MRLFPFLATTALVFLFTSAEEAEPLGIDLVAEAKVTAGLDMETRGLIKRLPEDIRKEALAALAEALPILDKSVSLYLNTVDDILGRTIAKASCSAQATAQGIFQTVAGGLAGKKPTPVKDVVSNWEREQNRYNRWATPSEYVTGYGDFLADAAIAACQVGVSAEAVESIMLPQQQARRRWLVWRRTLSTACTSAVSCFDSVLKSARSQVAAADKADVASSSAVAAINRVVTPKPPGVYGTFVQGPYEDGMIQLYAVLDGLQFARAMREMKPVYAPETFQVATIKMGACWEARGGDGQGGTLLSCDITAPGPISNVSRAACSGCGGHFWLCDGKEPRCTGRALFEITGPTTARAWAATDDSNVATVTFDVTYTRCVKSCPGQ